MLKAICLVVIEDGKLLLVKKNETWIIPGGKLESGESDKDCLIREFKEELPLLEIEVGEYFDLIKGITPHSKKEIEVKIYFGNVEGKLKPSSEINDVKFINDFENYNISDITKKVIKFLKENNHLNPY